MKSLLIAGTFSIMMPFSYAFSSERVTGLVREVSSPVAFLENKGQWNEDILFKGISTSTSVYLMKNGLSFAETGKQDDQQPESRSFLVWNMKFANPGEELMISGVSGQKSKMSFLFGNDPGKWVIHPNEYREVQYKKVFPNIDLRFYGSGNQLKYDYIVHPGGRLNSIMAYYEGVRHLSLNHRGELEVRTEWSTQVQKVPIAWQIINGVKQEVQVRYQLINDTTFGFSAREGFDPHHDLIIDPLFQMVWSSYTQATGAGNNINYCFANALDRDGNVYLTGMVDGTFPTTPGAYSGPGNVYPEVFVAKFSGDGTTLLYSTYLPGNSSEHGTGIAVDDSGRAYVTGVVDLNITGLTNFPSTPNAYQPVHNTGSDAFLTVLNSTGTGLVYSSFLGGTGSETGYGIALGAPGMAYITGNTSIGNFPVVASSVFPSGDRDLFVAKFDINQNGAGSLIYSTRIGGGGFSYTDGRGIAVNSAGQAFITGTVFSSSGAPSFPTTPGAYNSVFNTGQDGVMSFVTKLSANTPVTLSYSTFLAPGTANAIAVDAVSDNAFIAGSAFTFAFPTTPGSVQPVHAGSGGTDAFAARLNATGGALVYATFLGGPFADVGTGLAVNSMGEAYVTGIAQDSFPTSAGAWQPANAGTYDFFMVHLNANGTGYGCGGSTYVGGSDADYSGSFYDYPSPHVSIMDHAGSNDTVCVSSTSHSQDFPTTPGVYGPVKVNGIADQPVFFKMTCIPAGAAPNVNLISSDTSWCDKKAIDFFDLSTNSPTSWQWYFQGTTPDTSSLQNPAGIYYPAYGSFDVKLVACNANGCDSLFLPGFITEYQLPPAPVITQSADTLYSSPAYSYQWYDLNGPLPGATSVYFVPQAPQTYFVIITDSLGCSSPSGYMVINGIREENSFLYPVIIPNPSHDGAVLSFTMQQQDQMIISLEDVSGRMVKEFYSGEVSPGPFQVWLPLGDLDVGIYYCTIRGSREKRVVKLVCM